MRVKKNTKLFREGVVVYQIGFKVITQYFQYPWYIGYTTQPTKRLDAHFTAIKTYLSILNGEKEPTEIQKRNIDSLITWDGKNYPPQDWNYIVMAMYMFIYDLTMKNIFYEILYQKVSGNMSTGKVDFELPYYDERGSFQKEREFLDKFDRRTERKGFNNPKTIINELKRAQNKFGEIKDVEIDEKEEENKKWLEKNKKSSPITSLFSGDREIWDKFLLEVKEKIDEK